jgi:adhesin transport system outer membrane protein
MHQNSIDALKKDLQTQVQSYYDECMSSYLRNELVRGSIENNKSIFEAYGRLFVTGKRSWLDVINAARDYTQSKIDMSYLSSSYYGSLYKIKMLTAEIDFENKE